MEEIFDFCISPREVLVFRDKIMCTTGIDAEDSESISKLNKKLEKCFNSSKKKTSITSFFSSEKGISCFMTNDHPF